MVPKNRPAIRALFLWGEEASDLIPFWRLTSTTNTQYTIAIQQQQQQQQPQQQQQQQQQQQRQQETRRTLFHFCFFSMARISFLLNVFPNPQALCRKTQT